MENSAKPSLPRYIFLLILLLGISEKLKSQEFMPVHQASFHTPVYETNNFRILDVFLVPGDTSDMHTHDTPILYISFRKTQVYLEENNGNNRTVTLPNEWIGSDGYDNSNTHTHKIAASENDTLQIMAFQIVEGFSIDTTVISSNHSNYMDNGFVVNERAAIENYFSESDIPLIVKQGELKTKQNTWNKGDIVTSEQYRKWSKKLDQCELSFWQVSFKLKHTLH